jgi:hypothetical protein
MNSLLTQQARTNPFSRAVRSIRALARVTVFFLKVFPMIPSRPVDWVTRKPVIEKVRYPTQSGFAQGDLYRPSTGGPHPGILICLGVVPFEVDHPQVPVLGNALARAGFAALLYWSPAMRDFRLDPEDITDIPLAYDWLVRQPNIDPARSGMIGTCVGGAFALMAAAHPLVRDRVAYVGAYAPYSSMWTFARDIVCASVETPEGRRPWKVDQLTRRVFVHSLTAWLEPAERERLRSAFAAEGGQFDDQPLSAEGRSIYALLTAHSPEAAESALHGLPAVLQERLTIMSPITYIADLHTPLVQMLHDTGDHVIPIGESKRLLAALHGHTGVGYTEMHFSHLDPAKGKLPFFTLLREFAKFFRAMIPVFQQTVE